jgi:CHASE2 domain-containing sensor protein
MLGQTLAKRYRLTRILGAGGFGQTYLAVDIQQHHQPQCVVKQLKPASQDANFLAVARRLFETEVKTLRRLGDHPQIPALLDSFEEDNEFYLVQEFIDGPSLEDEIKQAKKFDEAAVIALLEDVLPVLQFIHEEHVIHRDLKPDNLIRRRESGEMVLIDFGAVKEIRTRLITGEQTALTIGIGTQGYTPSEQLAGKPRYASDLYALGMTAIHAATGQAPSDLPEDFGTLDPCWQEYAELSPGLAILLGKMTRHYIRQRYQSAQEVQQDLTRLDQLPTEAAAADTYLETSLPHGSQGPQGPQGLLGVPTKPWLKRWQMGKRAKVLTVAVATLTTSALVLGLRQLGAFVPSELAINDLLVSLQPDAGPDPRLLIVEITEADLRSLKVETPADAAVSQVIENLQKHQPARIGLDLLRDIPQEPGHAALLASLRAPNVVAITKLADPGGDDLSLPPPGLSFEQISFDNVALDPDFRVRRALMFDHLDNEILQGPSGQNLGGNIGNLLDNDPVNQPIFSVGTELAIRYLEHYHDIGPAAGDILQLNGISFVPVGPTFGGYQNAETTGYQMFMRYRSPHNVARRIRFSDVLKNNFDGDLVKNKLVLIGSTANSSRDFFLTPYNIKRHQEQMPGVMIHAQVISQILSVTLDGKPLTWAWPDWAEIIWIVSLTGIGSALMVLTHRGLVLIIFGVSGLLVVAAVSGLCFYLGGWVPMAAPAIAFFLSAAGARISKSYQRRYWEAHQ